MTYGMDMSLCYTTYRTEYRPFDFPGLYKGASDFNLTRLRKDVLCGDEGEAAFLVKMSVKT